MCVCVYARVCVLGVSVKPISFRNLITRRILVQMIISAYEETTKSSMLNVLFIFSFHA